MYIMSLNRIQKLLFSEYSDFEDMVLVESPFAETTREGRGIRQVQIGEFRATCYNFSYVPVRVVRLLLTHLTCYRLTLKLILHTWFKSVECGFYIPD